MRKKIAGGLMVWWAIMLLCSLLVFFIAPKQVIIDRSWGDILKVCFIGGASIGSVVSAIAFLLVGGATWMFEK